MAMDILFKNTSNIVLMQCKTNYTASIENFRYINLNVLKTYSELYPDVLLGLSDHTQGHSTVLGAVTLGARVIEKHFTDNNNLSGPDHKFSMNPKDWKNMVDRTRELEMSLGVATKKVEKNEIETVIIQRRGIRVCKDGKKGEIISESHLSLLRPCTEDCLAPYQKNLIIGKKAKFNLKKNQVVNEDSIE